ncbi:diguanylate cyclase [Herminiimonas sp. KBW02]|uniref:sensor domain-containing diguanylate cyclase n=1 Tax=Herminiimonas sp. KBW02 TaxID=2153363 RepID=UPI000F599DDF|nr:diguanylate cyclase [Herminiimonas sp. KBW02]RQO38777.1 diguanylate cyclase [Herminiimonas sp. KBW02]
MFQSLSRKLISKRRTLIFKAVLFIVLVSNSLIVLVAWDSWQARKNKLREFEISTMNMARALAQHASATIGSTDNILAGLVERIEEKGINNFVPSSLHEFLVSRVADQPIVGGLFVIDQNGHPLVTSYIDAARGISYEDRQYFLHHKTNNHRSLYIGPAVKSKSTNHWVLTVSRRLDHPDGKFAGLVLATIPLDYFKNFYDSFDISTSGAIFLASSDGIMLTRRPFVEDVIGTSVVKGPVFTEYRNKGPVGTAMLVAAVDKTERLYSYRLLDDYPLLVSVAIAKNDILSGWRTQTIRHVTLCIVLIFLITLFGIYLVVQINQKENTELKLREAKQELEALASEDSLTKLANRRKFDATLKTEFDRALRSKSELSLVMIDVDRFKQYNDIYGHPAGDECLRKIAEAIRNIPGRPADLCARYGGEEIAVLLPDSDLAGAIAIAHRIRAAVEEFKIPHSSNVAPYATISLGVASIRPTMSQADIKFLVKLADQALYKAKAEGRNRVCIA